MRKQIWSIIIMSGVGLMLIIGVRSSINHKQPVENVSVQVPVSIKHSVNPQSIASSSQAGWNTYTNTKFGYMLTYPASYVLSQESEKIFLEATGADAELAGSGCLIQVEPSASTSIQDLPQFLATEKNKTSNPEYPISYSFSVRKHVTMGGEPAIIVVPSGTTDQGTEAYEDAIEVATVHYGNVYTMTGYCTSKEVIGGFSFIP